MFILVNDQGGEEEEDLNDSWKKMREEEGMSNTPVLW